MDANILVIFFAPFVVRGAQIFIEKKPERKNFNPHYMHLKIGMKREFLVLFLVLNECLCCVEYQPQGMSAGIYKQYYNGPNSFAEIRLLDLSLLGSLLYKYKGSIHYCSSCILA